MSKYTWLGVVGLIAVCVGVFWFLWTNDPAHRNAQQRVTEIPTVRAGAVLTTLPGDDDYIAQRPGIVNCRPPAGARAAIRRAERLPDGALYFDVKVDGHCYGWIAARYLDVATEVLANY